MRFGVRAAGSALAVLLWVSPGHAWSPETGSSETACENAKLGAVARYAQCLIRALEAAGAHGGEALSESALARCDHRFDRAFEHAEASGGCRTPGGASTLREPIEAQVLATADRLTATADCTIVADEGIAVCQLDKRTSAVDLAALVDQLSDRGVTDDTIFWIQAWAGDGGNGNVCCERGGRGGRGGYVQTTTTLSAYQAAFGTTEMYYYLGLYGTSAADAGGDGGTATLATANDLAKGNVALAETLLIAGGGGGGGAGRGKNVCRSLYAINGGGGGAGATAAGATAAPTAIVAGDSGGSAVVPGSLGIHRRNNSGQGGQVEGGGSANRFNGGDALPGGQPTSPLGARGGNHARPQIGFANASGLLVSGGGGRGSDGGYGAGGGGGGGGYTGGGGGNRGTGDTDCVSGGGGGGSSFRRALPNSPTCSAIPTNRPGNPNGGEGFVQVTFDLGACG